MATIKNTGQSIVIGSEGDDYFSDQGSGAQSMIGGKGNDIYEIDNASDIVQELLNEGTDTLGIVSSIGYSMLNNATNVENLIAQGSSSSLITGNTLNNLMDGTNAGFVNMLGEAGNDTLLGSNGSDTLDGGTGADSMAGGSGGDKYFVDNAADKITENAAAGFDSVDSSVSFTLGANIENLSLSTINNINGTGNALDNEILGNSGNNLLSGLDGDDSIGGGVGNDTLNGGNGNDYLNTSATTKSILDGGAGNDTITGSNGALSLSGGAGNDYLATSNGAKHTLSGGDGNDFIDIDGGRSESVDGGTGDDIIVVRGKSSIDSSFNNTTLNGGAGNDTYYLQGTKSISKIKIIDASGNDSIRLVDNTGNQTTLEDATWAADIGGIYNTATGDSIKAYTLNDGIENLFADQSNTPKYLTGNTLNNLIVGTLGKDALVGLAGNDTLDGGTGADGLIGGLGNDVYVIDDANDTVLELANQGTDTVLSSVNFQLSNNVEHLTLMGSAISGKGNDLANVMLGNTSSNLLDAGGGNDSLFGDLGTDTLYGGNGNDTLDGGANDDLMYGGTGNDTYYVNTSNDKAYDVIGGGTDMVLSSAITYALGRNIENLTLVEGGIAFSGTGNDLNNVITGNSAANALYDGIGISGGWDTLSGGLGNDVYTVSWDSSGQDKLIDTGGNDTLSLFIADNFINSLGTISLTSAAFSSIENVTMSTSLNNTITAAQGVKITGSAVANQLSGSNLADTIDGGTGDDVVSGNDGADSLAGGAGNDTLIGSYGTGGKAAHTLDGGAGNDYFYFSTYDTFTEATTGGTDTIYVENTALNLANIASGNIENMDIYVNTANFSYVGTAASNTFTVLSNYNNSTATAYNVVMDGGANSDNYTIGTKYDLVNAESGDINSASVIINDTGTSGTDTVTIYIDNYTLTASVEDLILGSFVGEDGTNNGVYAYAGYGNSSDNHMTGNDGTNTLSGGAGSDTLTGGLGDDVYYVDDATATGDKVIEAANAGTDSIVFEGNTGIASNTTLTLSANIENGYIRASNLRIVGNTLDNLLDDNTLGTFTNSTLEGGAGNDTYLIGSTSTVLVEASAGGTADMVILVNSATNNFTLAANIEILQYNATVNAAVTGNTSNNLIAYTDTFNGADTLDGGAGDDTMDGGNGGDIYLISSTNDLVQDNGASGTDILQLNNVAEFHMESNAWNVENIVAKGTGIAINMTGNALANSIDLTGYTASGTGNLVYAGGGADTILGGAQAALLHGEAGNDVITGGAGNDTLNGDAGADTMTGGAGSDVFMFDDVDLSSIDTITDFVSGNDVILLNSDTFTLLASLGTLSSNEFRSAAGATTATTSTEYLIYNTTNGALYYDADGNGSSALAVQIASLSSKPALTAADFDFTT